jgi:hypothetical protein
MFDDVVRHLVQTLVAPNVLYQHYDVVPKPDVERAAATVKAEAFTAASKSIAAESSASIEEGATAVPVPTRLAVVGGDVVFQVFQVF